MEKSLSGIFSGIFVVGILVAIIFIGFAAHDLWCGAIDLAKESFKVAGFAIFVAVLFGGVGISMVNNPDINESWDKDPHEGGEKK